MTLDSEVNHIPWFLKGYNWTFVMEAFCSPPSEMVVIWTIFCIEFPVMCLAFYGLCCMFKPDHTVPIFVINLFVSDIIQIWVKPILHFCSLHLLVIFFFYAYILSVIANICFMVCISMERYVMIKYPVWYRLHHTCRNSTLLCLIVWAAVFGFALTDAIIAFAGYVEVAFLLSVVIFLLPYPLVVYFFVGSWRALSRSVSVSPDEQKRILRVLALVLFNYTVLFLPSIVQNVILAISFRNGISGYFDYLHSVSGILLYLNPLTDTLLYVFIRKDATSLFRCSLCCKKLHENHT